MRTGNDTEGNTIVGCGVYCHLGGERPSIVRLGAARLDDRRTPSGHP